MPVFSCGGMRYQHSWEDTPLSEIPSSVQENLENTVLHAIELGINHIETARGYGSSEIQLGQILPRIPRESIIVQTKIMPSPESFYETFNKSMSLLHLDFVDLLSIHGINNAELWDQSIRPGGCIHQARKIQREGRAKFLGFSTHGPLPIILQAIRSGEFDFVNLHWYWINQENWQAIEEAHQRDMGVFIISPNDKGGKLYAPPEKLSHLCAPLSPMEFNDLFCLSHPQVHTLSIGASKPSDFDSHLQILPLLPTASEHITPICQRLEKELSSVLGEDWVHHFLDHIPHWEAVPGHVNIRTILRLWNLDETFQMREYGKMRYNLLGQGGHWFPGKNAADMVPSDILSALKNHPAPEKIINILTESHKRFFEAPKRRLSEGG